ncbi:tRNA lysidine(34) synthetase TilS [Tessaracoccus palaemonis]|uniref:tRNA(Ile)-lysidine synthase n=1 Tax=Tessaracoccus palaemonis TaxID=2829499 RepID=A0ABX8SMM8_9ACTN|nr:tRNA lysidine(34) synthetase TilS [Tessaracoccus palaemonis]QXT62429.1 tRNA lysidine(34) synthetase TilS [Tessaracoccus palaemonis]
MARRELGPAALRVTAAVADALPGGDVTVGCSGGADSLALALGAHRAAARRGVTAEAFVVDHGLQPGSADVATRVVETLAARGVDARVVAVRVDEGGDGLEAAARDARLVALATPGRPVLLGHTLDDQAESVLLGLFRGSGTRSLAGMAPARGPFLRPLLGLRRADTEQACREWGLDWWDDPMNDDERFVRVRARRALADLSADLGRDLAPALARTAALARADADLLDALTGEAIDTSADTLDVAELHRLPDALRWRALRAWLAAAGVAADRQATLAVDRLVTHWHGQGPVALPGAHVARTGGRLRLAGRPGDTPRPASHRPAL